MSNSPLPDYVAIVKIWMVPKITVESVFNEDETWLVNILWTESQASELCNDLHYRRQYNVLILPWTEVGNITHKHVRDPYASQIHALGNLNGHTMTHMPLPYRDAFNYNECAYSLSHYICWV
jgi:hypothetical protein